MSRTLTPGTPVTVGTVAASPLRAARDNRDYGAHHAVTVRPYPGGQYDSGTLWTVRRANGAEEIADESMLTPREQIGTRGCTDSACKLAARGRHSHKVYA